ncbi:MAG: hypothetical protein H0T65_02205, partial [Deltaproteobacteria bacterium]|nr:hypothetical protein [Deltaproteobacteria bacterium]
MSTSASSNTLVDRVSLRNLIDSARRLDELGVARVIANVAEVVHKQQKGGQPLGTVTPEAIIVLADGDVTLQLTEAKAAYTAPEKLRGEPGDRRSDVFALGAILWEALAHERLFEGEIEGEIKASVLEGEYRSASEANANVPAELDAICKKALARSPGDRYSSAKVMAAEIAAVLDDAGYPEDNSAIAHHLQSRYVTPEPKAAPIITSRDTPIPGTLMISAPVTNDRGAANQTIQGISPRAAIDAAIELTQKKKKNRETLVGPTETRLPAEAPPTLVDTAPLVAMPAPVVVEPIPSLPAIEPRAKSPSSQPLATEAPRAKSPSS